MAKFLDKQDYDLFFELMRQREVLQQKIDEEGNDDFKTTAEGKGILMNIRNENQSIRQKLQLYLNLAKQQQTVSNAYDGGAKTRPVGIRLDRQG